MAIKLISVSYGHGTGENLSASGKLYDYETDKAYRTGDVVVVPVTHAKSGKTYNTVAVVRMTYSADSSAGEKKVDYLTDPKNNINTKNVSMRLEVAKKAGLNVQNDRQVNITTLPGYNARLSNEKWSRAADTSSNRLISRGG